MKLMIYRQLTPCVPQFTGGPRLKPTYPIGKSDSVIAL